MKLIEHILPQLNNSSDSHEIVHHFLLLMAYGLLEAVKHGKSAWFSRPSVDLQYSDVH